MSKPQCPDGAQAVSLIVDSSPSRLDLTRKISVLLDKADRADEKAEQFRIAAGLHIQAVKRLWPDHWLEMIEKDCKVGRSRIYEIEAIADGRTTVEKVRSDNAQRQRISRERRKVESVTSRTEPEPKPGSVEDDRDTEIVNAKLAELFVMGDDRIVRLRNEPGHKAAPTFREARSLAYGVGLQLEERDGIFALCDEEDEDWTRRFRDLTAVCIYVAVIKEVVSGTPAETTPEVTDDAATSGEEMKARHAAAEVISEFATGALELGRLLAENFAETESIIAENAPRERGAAMALVALLHQVGQVIDQTSAAVVASGVGSNQGRALFQKVAAFVAVVLVALDEEPPDPGPALPDRQLAEAEAPTAR